MEAQLKSIKDQLDSMTDEFWHTAEPDVYTLAIVVDNLTSVMHELVVLLTGKEHIEKEK